MKIFVCRTLSFLFFVFLGTTRAGATSDDPIVKDIKVWKEFIRTSTATDETSKYVRETSEPLLVKAEQALANGRRFYALHVLGVARGNLYAAKYMESLPAQTRRELPAFEAEWKRIGSTLAPVLSGKEKPDFNGLSEATRAIAEAAFSEVKVYYDASVEYGRNTEPESGVFYLGLALGQLEFARFCSSLGDIRHSRSPSSQRISEELDEFEKYLLSQYKPPASIEHHPVFIRTSAMIKQARELIDEKMMRGAFYRYLDARRRLSPVTGVGATIGAEEASKLAREVKARLEKSPEDHSLALLFIEMALAEASDTTQNSKGGETANVIFKDVLPHYFKALEPGKPKPPAPKSEVTVTLVRWPYT